MKLKPTLFFLAVSLLTGTAKLLAQDDLLKGIEDSTPKKEYVFNAFKSSRVIMSHSMEMLRPGILDFRILHRFSNVNQGISEFFGLDKATIRLGLDYGISNNLTVGVGRGSFKKEIDGFIKWRVIQQSTGPKSIPFSLLAVGGSTIIGAPWADPARKNYFSSRLGY